METKTSNLLNCLTRIFLFVAESYSAVEGLPETAEYLWKVLDISELGARVLNTKKLCPLVL